jgi:hypothetical protein
MMMSHLTELKGWIAQTLETTAGEEFSIALDYDVLADLAALIELARLAQAPEAELEQALAFVGNPFHREGEYDPDSFTAEDRQGLCALMALVELAGPVATAIERMAGEDTPFVIVNSCHYPGRFAVSTYNDRGAYEDPWDALRDLAELKRDSDNPYLYLGRITVVQIETAGEEKETPGLAGRCPYCNAPLGNPQADYDQGGYSVHTWTCANCGAVVEHRNYPPFADDADDDTCPFCGAGLDDDGWCTMPESCPAGRYWVEVEGGDWLTVVALTMEAAEQAVAETKTVVCVKEFEDAPEGEGPDLVVPRRSKWS